MSNGTGGNPGHYEFNITGESLMIENGQTATVLMGKHAAAMPNEGRREPRRPIRVLELRAAEGAGGGPEKTILLGAARSAPERFAVTVCYIHAARDRTFEIADRARQLGVDYVDLPQRFLVDWSVWRALRQLQRDRRFDIVHAHDYKTDLLALMMARSRGVVPLATAHGWTGHSWRERFVYYPADKRLLCRFPFVIAVSSEIRGALIRAGAKPERVQTVLNGIDHRAFRRDDRLVAAARAKWGFVPSNVVIGSMGRLEPQKRFDLLMEAFAALHRERPELRMLIAGEGTARDLLEKKAHALGIRDNCRLIGHCANVADFHHAIDHFVQSSDYEGTPNVVLEAMAMKSPVVATTAGGTGEIVENDVHGTLVPCGDAEALARAIDRTLTDPAATARRTRAARTRVENDLSFDARMRRVEAIYERLAGRGVW